MIETTRSGSGISDSVASGLRSGMARGPTTSSSTARMAAALPRPGPTAGSSRTTVSGTRRLPAGYAIKIWDPETGRELSKIPLKTNVAGMAFGSDGTTLTTVDHENRLQVWEVNAGREIATIKGNFPEGNRHMGVNKWVAFDARATASSSRPWISSRFRGDRRCRKRS